MGVINAPLFAQDPLQGEFHVPFWIVLICQAAMGLETLCGGWRIVHIMENKIIRRSPQQGLCAETGGALVVARFYSQAALFGRFAG